MFKEHSVILFQGDSITDCDRDRNQFKNLGTGYPYFLSSLMKYKHPDKAYTYLNRGISGNRIVDLYARMKEDIINLHPDVLSILIGVNDIWHEFSCKQGVDSEKFEKIYIMLLSEIKEALPELQIVLMEPFVLRAGERSENWNKWKTEMAVRQSIVHRISKEFETVYVPLQDKFNQSSEVLNPSHWAADGVHPTDAGHMLIASQWGKTVLGETLA